MKVIILAFSSLLVAQAQASIVDVFSCHLALVQENGTVISSENDRVSLLRKPEGVVNGVAYTRGDANLRLKFRLGHSFHIEDVNLVIRHAVKYAGTDRAEAYQSSTVGLSTTVCDDPRCLEENFEPGRRTPGDPLKYGKRVPVLNGVPAVDTSEFREFADKYRYGNSIGIAKVHCKYVETVQ